MTFDKYKLFLALIEYTCFCASSPGRKPNDEKEPAEIIENNFHFTTEYLMKFYKSCIECSIFCALSNEMLAFSVPFLVLFVM